MKKRTINKINVTHNCLTRALNRIQEIDENELNERENVALSKLKRKLLDILNDYHNFKKNVMNSRGLEYEIPY